VSEQTGEQQTGEQQTGEQQAGEQTPGIDDADLPEDLQPGEDNPLAEPLDPGEAPEVDLNEKSASYERQLEEDDGQQDGASDAG
jgi:hypothetical protein